MLACLNTWQQRAIAQQIPSTFLPEGNKARTSERIKAKAKANGSKCSCCCCSADEREAFFERTQTVAVQRWTFSWVGKQIGICPLMDE